MFAVGVVQQSFLLNYTLPSPLGHYLHDFPVPLCVLLLPFVLSFHPPFLFTSEGALRCFLCAAAAAAAVAAAAAAVAAAGIAAAGAILRVLGAGSQYCCWNSDSSWVALSSDFYQAVMVFDVHSKCQVTLLLSVHDLSSSVFCKHCVSEQPHAAGSGPHDVAHTCMVLVLWYTITGRSALSQTAAWSMCLRCCMLQCTCMV